MNENNSHSKIFDHPKIYDTIYAIPQNYIREKTWPSIKKYILRKRVLEFGAGYKTYLFSETKCKLYLAIDQNPKAVLHRNNAIKADVTKPLKLYQQFDTVLLTAILHHTAKHDLVLENAKKYGKTIIIFDNVRHHNLFLSAIQLFYYGILDKGNSYPSEIEWHAIFRTNGLEIIKYQRFGWLFNHLGLFILKEKVIGPRPPEVSRT